MKGSLDNSRGISTHKLKNTVVKAGMSLCFVKFIENIEPRVSSYVKSEFCHNHVSVSILWW